MTTYVPEIVKVICEPPLGNLTLIPGLYSKLFCGIRTKWSRVPMFKRRPGVSHMRRISKSAAYGPNVAGPIFERNTTFAAKGKYSRVRLRVYARVTRFTFSAAISMSLELKRSSIAL